MGLTLQVHEVRTSGDHTSTVSETVAVKASSVAPAARETYNALQTTVQHRFAHGFQLLAKDTWSHALNYGTTYFAIDPRVEKGPSDTNRNQLFVLSGIYEIPFGKDKMFANSGSRWVNYLVGGWQIAGTTTYKSGLPFTPTYAECGADQDVDINSASPSTSSDCRPDTNFNGPNQGFERSVGSYDPTTHSRRFFTLVAPFAGNGSQSGPFVRPAFGTIGNIGRNSFHGPSDYFADASLFKNFTITERIEGQFQFQAFNVFNHVPLGVPSASNARCIDCTESSAGTITEVDNALSTSGQPYMRQLQFGAKIISNWYSQAVRGRMICVSLYARTGRDDGFALFAGDADIELCERAGAGVARG